MNKKLLVSASLLAGFSVGCRTGQKKNGIAGDTSQSQTTRSSYVEAAKEVKDALRLYRSEISNKEGLTEVEQSYLSLANTADRLSDDDLADSIEKERSQDQRIVSVPATSDDAGVTPSATTIYTNISITGGALMTSAVIAAGAKVLNDKWAAEQLIESDVIKWQAQKDIESALEAFKPVKGQRYEYWKAFPTLQKYSNSFVGWYMRDMYEQGKFTNKIELFYDGSISNKPIEMNHILSKPAAGDVGHPIIRANTKPAFIANAPKAAYKMRNRGIYAGAAVVFAIGAAGLIAGLVMRGNQNGLNLASSEEPLSRLIRTLDRIESTVQVWV